MEPVAPLEPALPRRARVLPEENILLDREQLREISLLRGDNADYQEVSNKVCRAIFGLDQGGELPSAELLDYLQQIFPELSKESFDYGLEVEEVLEAIIDMPAGGERNEALGELSEAIEEDLGALRPGESRLLFAEVGRQQRQNPLAIAALKQLFPSAKLENADIDVIRNFSQTFIHDLSGTLSEGLRELFGTAQEELLRDLLSEGATSTIAARLIGRNPDGSPERAPGRVEELLLDLSTSIQNALKRRARAELTIEENALIERLANTIIERGLSDTLQEGVEHFCQDGVDSLQSTLNRGLAEVESMLPPAFSTIFSLFNSSSNYPRIWFEVVHDDEERYTLKVYGLSPDFHLAPLGSSEAVHQLPLIFRHLTLDQLSSDFFFRLLSYRAWPIWDPSISYSSNQIYENLLPSLGVDAEAAEPHSLVDTDTLHQTKDALGLLLIKLRHQIGATKEDFRLLTFHLKTETLLNLYKPVEEHPALLYSSPSLQVTLRESSFLLKKEALALHQADLINERELQIIYATTEEIAAALERASLNNQPIEVAGINLPSSIQQQIYAFLNGIGATLDNIDYLREGLVAIFGDPMAETIDCILDEYKLLLQNPSNSMIIRTPEGLDDSWDILTVLSHGQKALSYLTMIVKALRFGCNSLIAGTIINLLCAAIIALFPLSAAAAILAPGIVRNLITFFGALVIEQLLPQSVRLYYEQQRERLTRFITMKVVHYVAPLLLSKEATAKINVLFKHYQQNILRKGEISYRILPITSRSSSAAIIENTPLSGPLIPSISEPAPPLPPITNNVITPDNIILELSNWLRPYPHTAAAFEPIIQINRLIRTLPIPRAGEDTLWDQIPEENIPETLELLTQLALKISSSNLFSYSQLSSATMSASNNTIRAPTTISIHALYAIIDHLARRSPATHLDATIPANPWRFVGYMQSVYIQNILHQDALQLEAIYHYFHIDPSHTYTLEEIETQYNSSLFALPQFSRADIAYRSLSGNNQELDYWKRLAQDPLIARKLAAAGAPPESPETHRLITLLRDPAHPAGTLSPELETLFQEGTHLSDRRRGILPRPLYLLRLVHAMATSATMNQPFPLAEAEIDQNNFTALTPPSHSLMERIHAATGNIFRREGLINPRYSLEPPATTLENWRLEEGGRSRYSIFNREHAANWYLPSILHGYNVHNNQFFFRPDAPRSQEEVLVATPPAVLRGLSPENRLLLEMILSQREHQIIRTIGYFRERLHQLKDPTYRGLCQLLLLKTGLIQRESRESAALTEALGSFFEEALRTFIHDPDKRIALDLIEQGIFARSFSLQEDPNAFSRFPPFSEILYEQFLPGLRGLEGDPALVDLDSRALHLLALSLSEINLEELSAEQLPKVTEQIALVLYRNNCYRGTFIHSNMDRTNELMFRWRPFIQEQFRRDPLLKDRVLSALFYRSSTGARDQQPLISWSGEFPGYYHVSRDNGISSQIKIDFYTSRFDEDPIVRLQSAIAGLLGEPIEPLSVITAPGRYRTASGNLIVEECPTGTTFPDQIDFENKAYRLFKEIDGKRFRILLPHQCQCAGSPIPEAEIRYILLEEGPPGSHVELKIKKFDGKESALFASRSISLQEGRAQVVLDIHWNEQMIDGERLEELSLTGHTHELTLLSWFCPIEEMRVFRSPVKADLIRRIEFIPGNLTFLVDPENQRAYSQADRGYYIAPKQDDPQLTPYGSYLLLHGPAGEKKVYLRHQDNKQLATLALLKRASTLTSSPLIRNILLAIDKSAFPTTPYFSYMMDSEGKLTSKDPEALSYLLTYSIAESDWKEAERLLALLAAECRFHPLPESIEESLNRLTPLLLIDRSPESMMVQLRITALFAMNRLRIDSPLDSSPDESGSDPLDTNLTMRWVSTQYHYQHYLELAAQNCAPPLSELEELFLVEWLAKQGKKLFKQQVAQKCPPALQELLKQAGANALSEQIVMTEIIRKRYHFLKGIFSVKGEEQSTTQETVMRFLLSSDNTREPISGSASISTTGSQNIALSALTQTASAVAKCTRLIQKAPFAFKKVRDVYELLDFRTVLRERMLFPNMEEGFEDDIELAGCDFDRIPRRMSEANPKEIPELFLTYWRLAINEPPPHVEDREAFYLLRRDVRKLLPLLRSEPSSSESVLIELLVLAMEHQIEAVPTTTMSRLLFEYRSRDNYLPPPLIERLLSQMLLHKRGALGVETALAAGRASLPALPSLVGRAALHGALSTAIGPLYIAGQTGLQTLRTAQSAMRHYNQIQVEDEAIGEARAVKEAEAKVDGKNWMREELSEALHGSDEEFRNDLRGLLETHFAEIRPAQLRAETALVAAQESDNPMTRAHIDAFNESCTAFDDRGEELPATYLPRDAHSLDQLKQSIERRKMQLERSLDQERRELLSEINSDLQRRDLSHRSLSTMLLSPNQATRPVTFKELQHLFTDFNRRAFKKRVGVDDERLDEIEERLYFYFLEGTQLHQLERLLNLIDSLKSSQENRVIGTLQNKLIAELRASRSYQFNTISERLARAHLVLEWNNKIMLWPLQVQQGDRMLESESARSVIGAKPGCGKTSTIAPQAGRIFSDGTLTTGYVWPTPVAPTNMAETSAYLESSFGQKSWAMPFTREGQFTVKRLRACLRTLESAQYEGSALHMTKPDIQSLQALFILKMTEHLERSSRHASSPEIEKSKKELFYFKEILKRYRTKVKAFIDEAHELFNPMEELNLPIGEKIHLKRPWINITEKCFSLLKELQVLAPIGQEQRVISREEYDAQIAPLLALYLSRWNYFNLPVQDQGAFAQYLLGRSRSIPAWIRNHPAKTEIGLLKGLITLIIPNALAERAEVHFGASLEGGDEFAKPSHDSAVKENSTIQSPFEALVKSHLNLLYTKLSPEQIGRLIARLQRESKLEAQRLSLPEHETPTARFFARECPDIPLSRLMISTDPLERARAYELIQNSQLLTCKYVSLIIAPQITYYKRNIKVDSKAFGSMFKEFGSCTGMPYNAGVYPAQTQLLDERSTVGEIKHHLQMQPSSFGFKQVLASERPIDTLHEILDRFFTPGSAMSAIIDRGALLRGIGSNTNDPRQTVARLIMEHQSVHHPAIDGVIFYNKENKKMILRKDRSEPVEFTAPLPGHYITYFDQSHTYASDIPQPLLAEAAVTLAPNETSIQELGQAIFRMRGIPQGQKILLLVPSSASELAASPDLETLLHAPIAQEAKQLGHDHYIADRSEIINSLRERVLDKMLLATTIDEMLAIGQEFHSLFVSDFSDDPFELFGRIDMQVDPRRALHALKQSIMTRARISNLFTHEEKLELRDHLLSIGNQNYPESVHLYQNEDRGGFDEGGLATLGRTQEVTQEMTATQDSDAVHEEETEMSQERDNHLTSSNFRYGASSRLRVAPAIAWSPGATPENLNWFTLSPPPTLFSANSSPAGPQLYSFRDALQSSSLAEVREIANSFDDQLFCTSNFIPLHASWPCAHEAGGPLQKPISELLVIRTTAPDGSSSFRIGAIDHNDVRYWRETLRRDRQKEGSNDQIAIGIYNIATRSLMATGKTPLTTASLRENPLLIRAEFMFKFFHGDTYYALCHKEPLKEWILQRGTALMQRAFRHFYTLHQTNPYENSVLETIFDECEMHTLTTRPS